MTDGPHELRVGRHPDDTADLVVDTVELAACEDALVLGLYEAHGARVARGPFAIITLLARR